MLKLLNKQFDVKALIDQANRKKVLKQSINIEKLQGLLDEMQTTKELEEKLTNEYPILAWEWLNQDQRSKEALQVVMHCKSYENDPGRYSMYLHGWLHIWLWQE